MMTARSNGHVLASDRQRQQARHRARVIKVRGGLTAAAAGATKAISAIRSTPHQQ
jgi:hypothetical protein